MEEANFQYPQLEYIPEVEEFVDMSPDDQEPIGRSNLVDFYILTNILKKAIDLIAIERWRVIKVISTR